MMMAKMKHADPPMTLGNMRDWLEISRRARA
jgi:hypothetical protein